MANDFYIGIDSSLTHTGFIILDENKKLVYDTTIIPKKERGIKRLAFIKNEIIRILRMHSYPDKEYGKKYVALEGYAYMPKFGMSFNLGELGGIIKYLLYANNINYITVQPTTLKKFISGKGNCDKNQIMLEIYKKYKVELQDEHQADAYGLALMSYFFFTKIGSLNDSMILPLYQKEALNIVKTDIQKNNFLGENNVQK